MDQTFDLLDSLGASDEQLDFPAVYTSALSGRSGVDPDQLDEGMEAVFQTIVDHCPEPPVQIDGPLQLQVSSLDYSSYVGAIGIGRISRGRLRRNSPVTVVDRRSMRQWPATSSLSRVSSTRRFPTPCARRSVWSNYRL
jgi:GTP-binding protein